MLEEASASYYIVPTTAVVEPQLQKPKAAPLAAVAEPIKTAAKAAPKLLPDFDAELRQLSAEYAIDEGMVREIIFCESSNNPYALNRNTAVGEDVGYFQINSYYHAKHARKLGFDIYNPHDNLAYGFWLIKNEGVQHWVHSRNCHGY
jgi:soluble lytic murein transglycosylase-like protein